MAQRNQAFTDFIQHSRCVNLYTGKQVLVAGQGKHYHVAGCEMIDDSNGPHQEALHSALIVKSSEC